MYPLATSVTVTTSTGGVGTGYVGPYSKRVHAIKYTKPTGSPLASTADFTITTEDTGQNLWVDSNINATETVYPVLAANLGGTGAASTLTEVPVVACNERVKIAIAQGGNTKVGTFTVIFS